MGLIVLVRKSEFAGANVKGSNSAWLEASVVVF